MLREAKYDFQNLVLKNGVTLGAENMCYGDMCVNLDKVKHIAILYQGSTYEIDKEKVIKLLAKEN